MKKLNFGCGKKIMKGWINVDIQKDSKIDKSFDFNKFPYPFKKNTFDYILIDNVLEHLDEPIKVLDEIHRISKNNALIKITVPYYNSKGAYHDVTHKHYFNEMTFKVMIYPEKHYALQEKRKFRIKKSKLYPTRLGKLIYPKKIRYLLGQVIGSVFLAVEVELIVIK